MSQQGQGKSSMKYGVDTVGWCWTKSDSVGLSQTSPNASTKFLLWRAAIELNSAYTPYLLMSTMKD